jgi:hypothetical protein
MPNFTIIINKWEDMDEEDLEPTKLNLIKNKIFTKEELN